MCEDDDNRHEIYTGYILCKYDSGRNDCSESSEDDDSDSDYSIMPNLETAPSSGNESFDDHMKGKTWHNILNVLK